MRWRPLFFLALALGGHVAAAEETRPVWLVSNGFHTSLALRARDVPFRREIIGDPRADALLIGWGEADFYQGRVNAWTFGKSIFWPCPSVLHIVPLRGAVAARFAHSAVLRLTLPAAQFRTLLAQLDTAFARDPRGRRLFVARGYFADSRFYRGRERFYFPKMCNVWVAQKLHRSGLPFFVPGTMAASELMWQAQHFSHREQWLRRPVDAF